MRDKSILGAVVICVLVMANIASADIFGTGANQFTIDFVNISGDASSANGTNISQYSPGHSWHRTFADPSNDYRMGTYEITNDQWNKFQASYGTVMGDPSNAYDESAYFTGTDVPTNELSWYEGAQFVNYLNTSTGHQAAYNFTGTQGTADYTFSVWGPSDSGYDADNPFRNSNAFYFMPTEDEWVKAAYWNGTSIQSYATKPGEGLTMGNGTSGTGWNYHIGGSVDPLDPWDVGSGSQELNGTYDMMGNVSELMESPRESGDYLFGSVRSIRGGSYLGIDLLRSSYRSGVTPDYEHTIDGFRVASIPEPTTLLLLGGLGGLMLRKKRQNLI